MTELICFDLDDTLHAELDYARSGLRAVASYLVEHHGATQDLSDQLVAALDAGNRHRLFNDVLQPSLHVLIPDLVRRYRSHKPHIILQPVVRQLLQDLRRSGYVLAVLTDGPAVCQRAKINVLGLDELFDYLIVTDEGDGPRTWKPNPWGYLRLQEMVPAAVRFTYVGDNVEKDFVTARALGWRTIEIVRPDRMYQRVLPSPAHAADLKARNWASLRELLLASDMSF